MISFIFTPTLRVFTSLIKSLINKPNNVGDKESPCLTSPLMSNHSVILSFISWILANETLDVIKLQQWIKYNRSDHQLNELVFFRNVQNYCHNARYIVIVKWLWLSCLPGYSVLWPIYYISMDCVICAILVMYDTHLRNAPFLLTTYYFMCKKYLIITESFWNLSWKNAEPT